MARKKKKVAPFIFNQFSNKQKQLIWCWDESCPYKDYNIVIASGSIRAGKSIAAICGFLLWSQHTFQNQEFAIVGKSFGAITRNIVRPMLQILNAWGWDYHYTKDTLVVGTNTYNIFGAPNESSQDVLQGLTLAGALVDEGALIPESYFNQLNGRCLSIDNHKIWVACNPGSPTNYIKKNWLDMRNEKGVLYLHFTLDDNLSLSDRAKQSAKQKYMGKDGDMSNVFYQRYILGKWVNPDGVVYTGFGKSNIVKELPKMVEYTVGADFGDSHPTTFVMIGKGIDGKLYIIKEYKKNKLMIDKYANDLKDFITGYNVKAPVIDCAASSFIRQVNSKGIAAKGVNKSSLSVVDGIAEINSLLANNKLLVHESCKETIAEFYSYCWDSNATEKGADKVIKLNDDLMDALRYCIMTYHIKKKSVIMSSSRLI